LLFQRQSKINPVIELKFESVEHFDYSFLLEFGSLNDDEATLLKENDLFYWADASNWIVGNQDNGATWISGKKLFWKLRPELAGNIQRINDSGIFSRHDERQNADGTV
jgi:hypothetical protein